MIINIFNRILGRNKNLDKTMSYIFMFVTIYYYLLMSLFNLFRKESISETTKRTIKERET